MKLEVGKYYISEGIPTMLLKILIVDKTSTRVLCCTSCNIDKEFLLSNTYLENNWQLAPDDNILVVLYG